MSETLVRWRCPPMQDWQTVSSSYEFLASVYLESFVNVFAVIGTLLSNSLVIYGAYKNKQLNKITRTLSILLALVGLFGALVIQSSYATSKFTLLTNTSSPDKTNYCILSLIVAYGTKMLGGISITVMLCITAERFAAVIYPFYYRKARNAFIKALPFISAVFLIHFILSDIWSSYNNVAKVLTAIFTLIPYIITIYAYGKIFFHFRKRRGTSRTTSKHTTTSVIVVTTYLICFFPLIIIRSFNLDNNILVVQLYVRPWCNTLLFCSFSINAIVYGWRSIVYGWSELKRLRHVHVRVVPISN